MNYRDTLGAMRERSAPSPAAIGRVRARLDLQLVPATTELARLPAVRPAAVARVRARLVESRQRRTAWPPVLVGTALAAAATTIALGLGTRDGPPEELLLAGAGHDLSLTGDVVASHEGRGHASVDDGAVTIDWEIGRIELDVTPNHGAKVLVTTPEGQVRVVGTKLSVERDALGTRVSVDHGTVAVSCGGTADLAVRGGEAAECLPVTPSGLLNRARALEQQGASADAILASVDDGVAAGASGNVLGELLTLRVGTLIGVGRTADALDAAEAALASDPDASRSLALHRTAARLALLTGACERALGHLDALPSDDAEQALRERCPSR